MFKMNDVWNTRKRDDDGREIRKFGEREFDEKWRDMAKRLTGTFDIKISFSCGVINEMRRWLKAQKKG
jgi:hypothetical protein